MTEKPTIIGFNSIHFDNAVLQPYFSKLKINDLPQVDILADIYRTLGFRMKLESVAQATLGEGKSGTGLDAIRYYREGNLEALAKYCDVYEYGYTHGYILYTSGGEYFRMPVNWSTEPTLHQQLIAAFQKHRQIQLTYLQLTDTSRTILTITRADILDFSDKAAIGTNEISVLDDVCPFNTNFGLICPSLDSFSSGQLIPTSPSTPPSPPESPLPTAPTRPG